MTAYDFVHLSLLAMGGSVQGKTKLQKTVYFLAVMTGHTNDLEYRAHYYGPYSQEVSLAVGKLEGVGFVETDVLSWGMDSRGFERTRTNYTLTPDGRSVAEMKAENYPSLWHKLLKASVVLRDADMDYMKLSVAAKTYFLLGERGGKGEMDELRQMAGKFHWQLSDSEIDEAVEFLESVKLV